MTAIQCQASSKGPENEAPLVSVLIAVYNADECFLRETLRSVEAQTFRQFEVILILDGPDPVARRVWPDFQQPGWRLIPLDENHGRARALNLGLRQCRGSLIARLDADDVAEPDRLSLQVEAFETRPSLGVLGTAALDIDDTSNEIGIRAVQTGARDVARGMLVRNRLIHPSVMFRRDVIERAGGYNEQLKVVDDYDLWLRCIALGEVDNLPQPLVRYRQHKAQATRQMRPNQDPINALARSRMVAGRSLGVRPTAIRLLELSWRTAQILRELPQLRRLRGVWGHHRGSHRP